MPLVTHRILVAALFPALSLLAEEPKSSLTILVLDPFGSTIPARVETFRPKEGSAELASHFDGLRATAIPQGKYVFTLRRLEPAEPNGKIWGNVSVELPSQTVVVVAEKNPSAIAADYPPYSTTKFRLDSIPDASETRDPLRVRLSGLVSSDQEDALVDLSGEFRIHGWLHGPYILTVLRGRQVIAVQPIVFHDMSRADTVVIKLPSEAPVVVHIEPHR
jgi:hypothetical protein